MVNGVMKIINGVEFNPTVPNKTNKYLLFFFFFLKKKKKKIKKILKKKKNYFKKKNKFNIKKKILLS